jgi:hypothetical protein
MRCLQPLHRRSADSAQSLTLSLGVLSTVLVGAALAWTFQTTGVAAAMEWRAREGGRWAPIEVRGGPRARLELADPRATGLNFSNTISEARHLTNQVFLNGSGVAAGDVDGDGLADVFFCGFDNDNGLFRNRGNWRFEDVTEAAGVRMPGIDCTGTAMGDLDGDGDLDLVVNTLVQGTAILLNDGRGRFTQSGPMLNPGRGAMTVAMADVDGDGLLDLYIANYRIQALMDMPNTRMTFKRLGNRTVVDTVNGRPASDPEFADRFVVNELGGIEENGEPDVLYRNLGGGRFVEVPWTSGTFLDEEGRPLTAPPRDWGLAAMFHDVNRDGRPDLYVCNDFQSPDRLWIHQGDGRFRLAPALALRRTSLSSMAVDFADIDADGHDDFLVLEMMSRDHGTRMRWVRENFPHRPVVGRYEDRPQIEGNTLQRGRGDGSWAEIAQLSGLEATEWSWACAFLDVDLDGWQDVLVANGMERAGRDLDAAEALRARRQNRRLTEREVFEARRIFPRLATTNLVFRNRGDLSFADVSAEWGFDLAGVSQAIALADLDNDGDLDAIVGNLNAAAAVYRNDAPAPRVGVRLAGRAPNTRGIGARIEVLGGPVPQAQEMTAGGRYLSGDDPLRSFATGSAGTVNVVVRWPSGTRSDLAGVPANSLLEVAEPAPGAGAGNPSPSLDEVARGGIAFEDLSARLNHRHREEATDDYARQPLLPRKLSQPGPGLAWVDLDADGDDDLVVGAGEGGRVAAFRNEGKGSFAAWEASAFDRPLVRDATALLGMPRTNGLPRVLVALSNYEDGAALGPAVLAWNPGDADWGELATAAESSPGPLVAGDIDGDGDLDLFLGGRSIPGRWPLAASSRFLRNDQGRFVFDVPRSRPLQAIGLVTGAVFSDLDADGDGDLILACEWGPIRVLRQEAGGFVDVTEPLGLTSYVGWWTSVAAGDFDNDGRLDLVAGNWGRNTPYERYRGGPVDDAGTGRRNLELHHGDFDGNGTHDVVEAHYDPARRESVPNLALTDLGEALPFLRGKFPSHAAFGAASIDGLLGDARSRRSVLQARFLESAVFLNRGDRFEMRVLPVEAQIAPAFGLAVADADGDGNEDLFLAQNFFAVRPHTPRHDGGVGLWLQGDGHGGFKAVSAQRSGIRVFGEQRAAAVADFDGDGRIDLAVGQNGAETRLYRNREGTPGVRVRFRGPAGNPGGVGVRFRWLGTSGPMHEVRLGEGYLSQHSLTRPIARPARAEALQVFWPGGVASEYRVEPDATDIVLDFAETKPSP